MLTGFLGVFVAVFIAELGDKTQLAAALFAADSGRNPWIVFAAASAALVSSTAIAVWAGAFLREKIAAWPLEPIAGGLFVALGGWMVISWLAGR